MGHLPQFWNQRTNSLEAKNAQRERGGGGGMAALGIDRAINLIQNQEIILVRKSCCHVFSLVNTPLNILQSIDSCHWTWADSIISYSWSSELHWLCTTPHFLVEMCSSRKYATPTTVGISHWTPPPPTLQIFHFWVAPHLSGKSKELSTGPHTPVHPGNHFFFFFSRQTTKESHYFYIQYLA